MKMLQVALLCLGALFTTLGFANSNSSLPVDLQKLKLDVLQLNQELNKLEQDLLFPSTQTTFYVAVDLGSKLRLVDVNFSIDGNNVGYHYYNDQEYAALGKGGVHKAYTGNLTGGPHVLKANVTGYDAAGKSYQRAITFNFSKGPGQKFIELRMADDVTRTQPDFQFKEWDSR